jgi:hypothetical protein
LATVSVTRIARGVESPAAETAASFGMLLDRRHRSDADEASG